MDMGMQPGVNPGMQDPSMMGNGGMQDPSMMGGAGAQDPNMMGNDPMGDPSMGGDPNAVGGQEQQNPYDTNFDAGVEADEDTDPKRYIQQLTGKLSQSLNDYNTENGEDSGLAKYVGKMIVKQAAKALDEKGRKDLIKAINTADSADEEEDEEMPEDGEQEVGNEQPMDGQEPMEQEPQEQPQQPMQEAKFTKRDIRHLYENICNQINCDDEEKFRGIGNKKDNTYKRKTKFSGKILRKS